MAKRMTDTEKWKKPFFKSLPAEYKLFWIYLTDDINHAGIWEVDKEIAELRLGTKLSLDKALGLFKERVVVFDNGTKWFLPDFIKFQYGILNEGNKVHRSVIILLKKYNLLDDSRGLLAPKDKDKDSSSNLEGNENSKGEGISHTLFQLPAIEPTAEDISFANFTKWIAENAKDVGKMTEPFTKAQYLQLVKEYDGETIKKRLIAMHNWIPLLTKNKSAKFTFDAWAEKDKKLEAKADPKSIPVDEALAARQRLEERTKALENKRRD